MAVEIIERWNSRPLESTQTGGSATFRYLLRGSVDELEVYNFLLDYMPATYANLWLTRVTVDPIGGPVWEGVAEYGVPQTQPAADLGDPTQTDPGTGLPGGSPNTPAHNDLLGPEFSLATTGGTEKLRLSKGWYIRKAIAGRSVPEFRGLIGPQDDGTIEGAEVIVPKVEWKTTRHVKMTLDYQAILADLTGTINDRDWFGWKAGQVLFLGSDASFKEVGKGWNATFAFQIARHRVCTGRAGDGIGGRLNAVDGGEDLVAPGLVLGSRTYSEDGTSYVVDTTEVVRGWDYLWVAYEESSESNTKKDIPRAWMFEVCKVYEESDFRLLGLGG